MAGTTSGNQPIDPVELAQELIRCASVTPTDGGALGEGRLGLGRREPGGGGRRRAPEARVELVDEERLRPLPRPLVALPLSARGFLTAAVLTFTHTLGEFGVVLMVGGNIPGETRVLSIAIYDHVESLRYAEAHTLAAGLLIFSFVVLWAVYTLDRKSRLHVH